MNSGAPSASSLGTADGVRAVNADLDEQLVRGARRLDPDRLFEFEEVAANQEAWNAAMLLAHAGEFPRFFADEIRRFVADASAPIGRTHQDPQRLAAVSDVRGARDVLVQDMEAAMQELAAALTLLQNVHLSAPTNNRRYGVEPLSAFLDRYVLAHKHGHITQLAGMPASPPPTSHVDLL